MAVSLFWVSVFLIIYHHAGYPVLLHGLARMARRRRARAIAPGNVPSGELPSVTMIIPAHNEAAVIASKIANLGELDYAPGRFTAVIALDGCTDQTKPLAEAALASVAECLDARIVEYPSNVGKVAVLNDRIPKAASDIVAVSDASARIGPDSLTKAARHFANPLVGVVCGTYTLADASADGERAYWKYQTQIKVDEGDLAAPMGAHGAFYLFRRSAWSPLPLDTINDDTILPMTIVRRGYRAVYDPAIIATELERSHSRQEFRRRIRIGAGNLQQVLRLAPLADPRRGWIAFIFVSGKGLRAILPFLFVIALLSTVPLAMDGQRLYQGILAGQIAILTLPVAGILGATSLLPRRFAILSYIVQGHVASALGTLLLLAGLKRQAWNFSSGGKHANASKPDS